MSVTSTRRVSGSTVSSHNVQKYYGDSNESFVEHIDTTNNVAVRDEKEHDTERRHQSFSEKSEEQEQKNISTSPTYVTSAIEALAASGVYDIPVETPKNTNSVGVYDNNQAIVRDEEVDSKGRSYLKHFYEKNELLQEVNKLI